MKALLTALALLISVLVFAQTNTRTHYVRGYTKRSSGTYVMPHRQTNPNHSKMDNYSTKGNNNPYTGKTGKKKVNNSLFGQ